MLPQKYFKAEYPICEIHVNLSLFQFACGYSFINVYDAYS